MFNSFEFSLCVLESEASYLRFLLSHSDFYFNCESGHGEEYTYSPCRSKVSSSQVLWNIIYNHPNCGTSERDSQIVTVRG
jgi:hypothetical protein